MTIFTDQYLQQIAALLSQPAAIPFALALISGLFVYHIKQRRRMLAGKAVMDVCYGIHFWMMQAPAGAYGIMIAVFGGLVQIVTPDHLMRRTMLYRNIVAALLALLGVFLAVQHSTDLLPLIAASTARFVETHSQPQRIRAGMALTLLLWIAYAAYNNLILMVIASVTLLLSTLLALYRHRAKKSSAA
ncbi:MAG: YgjV family protein [Alphaproteobacteria bacterium]